MFCPFYSSVVPVSWRMCPRAGTVPLASASSEQTLIRLLQPQIITVLQLRSEPLRRMPLAHRMPRHLASELMHKTSLHNSCT